MTITKSSSRELSQDATRATKAIRSGPVFSTDRVRPAHVLLSIEENQRLAEQEHNLVDALSMAGLADIDLEFLQSRALPRADIE